jgi:hypothetical protein
VDDTFVIWPHGTETLELFLDHLNGLHRNIQCTMETERVRERERERGREGHLPFRDIDIDRRPNGALGPKVYRKLTHTILSFNPGSHHHLSSIQGVLSNVVHRTRALCHQESLHDEMDFLKTTSKENGYSIKRYDRPLTRQLEPPETYIDRSSSVCPNDIRQAEHKA